YNLVADDGGLVWGGRITPESVAELTGICSRSRRNSWKYAQICPGAPIWSEARESFGRADEGQSEEIPKSAGKTHFQSHPRDPTKHSLFST
ncbi:MAG: hypothetical protein JW929_07620, partial [Anaerolineales bacterium]|nr:hypothetical protein [Anaerolineales bacterium]